MSGKLMELAIAIRGKLDSSLPASVKETNENINRLSGNLKQLQDISAKAGAWKAAAGQVRLYKRELAEAQKEASKTSEALKISGNKSSQAANAYKTAQRNAKQMATSLHESRGLLVSLSAELQAAGFNTKDFAESETNLKNQIAATNKALEQQKQLSSRAVERQDNLKAAKSGYSKAKQGLMQSFANFSGGVMMAKSLAAPLVEAVQVAANFEQAMSKVQAITNADEADTKKLATTARDLGAKTKFSATQAAEAMSYLGMAGWKTDQIIAGMPGLLNLAAASGADLAQTADIVSDDLTAFGMQANQAGHMADVMAAASTNANTNVVLMGATFKYAGAVAGALGYSLEDVALATGLMANAGIKGEQAGTSLRSMMSRMTAPTKQVQAAMDKLGLTVKNSDGSMKPFGQTMQELRAKFAGMSDSEKAQYASMIAGQEAMSGFLAIVNASDSDFAKLSNAVNHADGAAAKMAKTMNQNAQGALVQLQSATESAQISVGNVFLPILAKVATYVAGVAGSFAKWAEEHPRLVTALAAVAGAVAAVLLGLLAFSVAVSTVKYVVASIKLFKAAMQGAQIATKVMAGAQAALNFVMSMNPIALVIIGVMALIAALIYLYNNSETVRNFIDWAAQSIATAWNTAVTSISETVAEAAVWISSQWQYICDTADSAWNAITSTIQSVWETVYSVVDEGVQWVQNKWEQLKGVFSSPITTAIKFITSSSSNENPDRNAYGGLITRPTLSWVGEAGDPEMIVPINRTQNAMRLWQSAGQMLGVEALQPVRDPAPLLGSRGTGVTVNFAPTIQVSGGATTADQIRTVLREQEAQFEAKFRRLYQEMVQRERRLSFD